MPALPTYIPSPPWNVWHLGPVPLRAYALCILAGIVVAWIISSRRWKQRGGDPEKFDNTGIVMVVCGIIGARIYFVLVDGWSQFFGSNGHPLDVVKIWQGGLGIMGGVLGGAVGALLMARHYRIRFSVMVDCVAPTLPIAQAIGRLGNWFNQEVYGLPTTLPWGLRIDPAHRVPGYEQYATFHPTFLYEILWNLLVAAFLFFAERRWKLGRGKLLALYFVCYATGRFLIEFWRIDPVPVILGVRSNGWAALALALIGLVVFLWWVRNRPGQDGPTSAASLAAATVTESPERDTLGSPEPATTVDAAPDAVAATEDGAASFMRKESSEGDVSPDEVPGAATTPAATAGEAIDVTRPDGASAS